MVEYRAKQKRLTYSSVNFSNSFRENALQRGIAYAQFSFYPKVYASNTKIQCKFGDIFCISQYGCPFWEILPNSNLRILPISQQALRPYSGSFGWVEPRGSIILSFSLSLSHYLSLFLSHTQALFGQFWVGGAQSSIILSFSLSHTLPHSLSHTLSLSLSVTHTWQQWT